MNHVSYMISIGVHKTYIYVCTSEVCECVHVVSTCVYMHAVCVWEGIYINFIMCKSAC